MHWHRLTSYLSSLWLASSVYCCADQPAIKDSTKLQCEELTCGVLEEELCGVCKATEPKGLLYGYGLCDDSINECIQPKADCNSVWCYIPRALYTMGSIVGVEENVGHIFETRVSSHPSYTATSCIFRSTEITVQEWEDVMEELAGDRIFHGCGDNCPATGMTLFGAMEFANRVSEKEGLENCYVLDDCGMVSVRGHSVFSCAEAAFSGCLCEGYRLPSEEEWELAATGGAISPYLDVLSKKISHNACSEHDGIGEYAWFCGNSKTDYAGCTEWDNSAISPLLGCYGPREVGKKKAGPFGLFDMNGNIAEFTHDLWSEPTDSLMILTNQQNTVHRDDYIAIKGGGYSDTNWRVLASYRHPYPADKQIGRQSGIGIRLVRSITNEKWSKLRADKLSP